jgi:hypothetical protein
LTMPGGNFDLHQLTPLPCAQLRLPRTTGAGRRKRAILA